MDKKKFVWMAGAIIIFIGLMVFLKFSGSGLLTKMESGGTPALIPLIAVAALLDSLNPCAFSVLLLTVAFLFNMGESRKRILAIGGTYIFGIFTVYVLIGLGILRALSLFNIPGFMGKFGATIIIILGIIDLIGAYFPKFPIQLKIPASAKKPIAVLMQKGSVITAFILGIFVGLVQFPCVGGPYLLILGLLHDSNSFVGGFGLLLFYNLLFLVPLIVVLVIASNESLLTKVQEMRSGSSSKLRFITGLAMIVLGSLIFLL